MPPFSIPTMKRAIRRHHRERLKAKRRDYWGGAFADDPKWLGKIVTTPHPMQHCLCCVNQRAIEGPTRQEIRAECPSTLST